LEVLARPELISRSVYTSVLPAVPAGQGTGATFRRIAEEAARTAGARATVATVDGLPQLADPAIKLTTKRNQSGVPVMRISYVVGPNPPGPQTPGDRRELLFFDLGSSGILEFFPSDSHSQTAEAMNAVAKLLDGLVDRVQVAK